ncbi:MAG: hypothetical protein H6834_05420 [Planctomycetes bacterium]|nr:hypothetical protein [Planctomycetota bacterium]
MKVRRVVSLPCLVFMTCVSIVMSRGVSAQSKVTIERREDRFQLVRNGQALVIHGVGGETRFAELAAAGGNSVRTWGASNLGTILDEAHAHGLSVCAGLWLGHPRHGFDYHDEDAVLKQLDEKLAIVRRYKHHPALLIWGVGNEAEGRGDDPAVFYAVNHLAREIKRIDPDHPTMTVIAELGENASKVRSIERFCADVDIVGVNSYGGVESLGKRYREAGGTKPYVVAEHGPLGPWESGKTAWGAPLEWTSTEKGLFYAKGYRANVVEHADLCLGSYAFLWGHKQETTATWFGMLLPDGSRLAAVDAMTTVWTGSPPANRCPTIESLRLEGANVVEPGAHVSAVVRASDPEGDALRYEWTLRSDAGTVGMGGDPQEQETAFPLAVTSSERTARIVMPKGGGGYRLFVSVRDEHGGAAVANVPLRVAAPIELTEVLPIAKLPFVVYDEYGDSPGVYVPSGFMGNVGAVRMALDCRDDPHGGTTCIEARYESGTSWGGVLWQSPADDWNGEQPGGANLSAAAQLEFWVRGAHGGEKVNFVFGVLDGNQPYRDTAKGELREVTLTKAWNKMTIPLRGLDLRRIKTGFGWSLAGQGQPVVFYLDDIRYVAEK